MINLNLEHALRMTSELLSISFILKWFRSKWRDKYGLRSTKESLIDDFSITIGKAQWLWKLEEEKLLAMELRNFASCKTQCPFLKSGFMNLHYAAKEVDIYFFNSVHDKGPAIKKDLSQYALEKIYAMRGCQFRMQQNPQSLKLRFHFEELEMNHPQELHQGGEVFQMFKQVSVATAWFKQKYLSAKRKYNFHYHSSSSKAVGVEKEGQKKQKRTLYVGLKVDSAMLRADNKQI